MVSLLGFTSYTLATELFYKSKKEGHTFALYVAEVETGRTILVCFPTLTRVEKGLPVLADSEKGSVIHLVKKKDGRKRRRLL